MSGSVDSSTDASPLDTAWRETHEVTGLDASCLRLYRRGKPYAFVDEGGGEWSVYQ